MPFRSPRISIEEEGLGLYPLFQIEKTVRVQLSLPEDEPLILYPSSKRDHFGTKMKTEKSARALKVKIDGSITTLDA